MSIERRISRLSDACSFYRILISLSRRVGDFESEWDAIEYRHRIAIDQRMMMRMFKQLREINKDVKELIHRVKGKLLPSDFLDDLKKFERRHDLVRGRAVRFFRYFGLPTKELIDEKDIPSIEEELSSFESDLNKLWEEFDLYLSLMKRVNPFLIPPSIREGLDRIGKALQKFRSRTERIDVWLRTHVEGSEYADRWMAMRERLKKLRGRVFPRLREWKIAGREEEEEF